MDETKHRQFHQSQSYCFIVIIDELLSNFSCFFLRQVFRNPEEVICTFHYILYIYD